MSQDSLNFDHETRGWVDLIPSRVPRPKLTTQVDTKWLVIGAGLSRTLELFRDLYCSYFMLKRLFSPTPFTSIVSAFFARRLAIWGSVKEKVIKRILSRGGLRRDKTFSLQRSSGQK